MKFSPLAKLKVSLLVLISIFVFAPSLLLAAPSTLVIDEFRTRSESDILDEYIIVANYGLVPVNLEGYALKKKTASLGSTPELIYKFVGISLEPSGRFTISCSDYNGTATLADTNNVIILYSGASAPTIVDSVAYGTVSFAYLEGTALKNPAKAVAYRRTTIPENDNNSLDFEAFIPIIPADLNADKIVISELLPSPVTGGEEWFELHNPTNINISLANLKMCDAMGSRSCYPFDKSEYLLAGSYKTYPKSLTGITLNDNGDWLELYDSADTLLTDSGGNYISAKRGFPLALFGTDYMWTKTQTPDTQNIYTETDEIEEEPLPKAKTSKSKIVTAIKKTAIQAQTKEDNLASAQTSVTEVKAAETTNPIASIQKAMVDRKILGWALIGLAILLLLGYTSWYFRDYAKNIYDKIRHGDDSARF